MSISAAERSSAVLAWERYRERLVSLDGTAYALEEPLAWAALQEELASIDEEAGRSADAAEA